MLVLHFTDGTVLLLSFEARAVWAAEIFMPVFLKGDTIIPLQSPKPANSSADEVGLWLVDGETLYFLSNRTGGLGGQDFYVIRRLDGELV